MLRRIPYLTLNTRQCTFKKSEKYHYLIFWKNGNTLAGELELRVFVRSQRLPSDVSVVIIMLSQKHFP